MPFDHLRNTIRERRRARRNTVIDRLSTRPALPSDWVPPISRLPR